MARSTSSGTAVRNDGVLTDLAPCAWTSDCTTKHVIGATPPSLSAFLNAVFTTPQGWAMSITGVVVGGLFAAFAMAVSALSFPLLLDRNVGVVMAVKTSLRAVATNPSVMALWGLTVALLLVAGSIPALFGLIFIVPMLGHATWRLYRRVIA